MSRGGDANETVRDYSAYSQHGTFGTTQPTRGIRGDSICGVFAAGAVNYYTTPFALPLVDFTATAWFYPIGNYTFRRIVDFNYSTGFWLGHSGSSGANFGGGVQNSGPPYGIFLTGTLNAWQFIAIQRIGSTAYLHLWGPTGYQTTSGACGGTALNTSNRIHIGCSHPAEVKESDNWAGGIDEVRIYDRAIDIGTLNVLASRRGIAYETKPRPLSRKLSAATFKSAWARNSNVLIGL